MLSYTFALQGTPQQKTVALIRNEIDDITDVANPVVGTDYFVTDDRILAFYAGAKEESPEDANEVEVRLRACSAILDTLATNQAYQLKVGRTLGEERDGKAVADAIRAHATRCAKRADMSLAERRRLAAESAAQAARDAQTSMSIETEFVF